MFNSLCLAVFFATAGYCFYFFSMNPLKLSDTRNQIVFGAGGVVFSLMSLLFIKLTKTILVTQPEYPIEKLVHALMWFKWAVTGVLIFAVIRLYRAYKFYHLGTGRVVATVSKLPAIRVQPAKWLRMSARTAGFATVQICAGIAVLMIILGSLVSCARANSESNKPKDIPIAGLDTNNPALKIQLSRKTSVWRVVVDGRTVVVVDNENGGAAAVLLPLYGK